MFTMGRKKREETKVHGIRLPVRLWEVLRKTSTKEYRSMNAQIWKIVEDWLVERGHIKDKDRTR